MLNITRLIKSSLWVIALSLSLTSVSYAVDGSAPQAPALKAEETATEITASDPVLSKMSADMKQNAQKFGVHASMLAQEGKGAELAGLILAASEIVGTLKGSEVYIVQLSSLNPDLVLITEIWTSQADHKASLENPQLAELIQKARPLIKGIDHNWAVPIGGKGL